MMEWPYKSSSGPGSYKVQLADSGKIVCDCRGWLIKKDGKPRKCRHIDDVIKKSNFTFQVIGEFVFITDSADATPLAPSQVDYAEQYHSAHTDGYIQPMLASAMTKRKPNETWDETIKPYQNGLWISEIKFDGKRVIVSKTNGKVFVWSRPKEGTVGKPCVVPPHIHAFILSHLPDGTYDGEDIAGLTGKSYDVSRLDKEHLRQYVLFDVLKNNSAGNICGMPLRDRRKLLEIALQNCDDTTPIVLAKQYQPSAQQVQDLWDSGAEGIILKRLDSTVTPGWRSTDWLKIKSEFYVTCTVTGYEEGKEGPYAKLLGISTEGVAVTCKSKDAAMRKALAVDPEGHKGRRFVLKHYGPTPDGKYRGPTIFDHWAGEGE